MPLADDADTLDFMNPSLLAQAEQLARRKAELKERAIDAARQAGVFRPAEMTENPGFTSAVTGTRVVMPNASPGKFGKYAPLAQQLLHSFETAKLDEDNSGYQRLEADASRRHLASKPPDDAPDADKLAWAQRGAQIPALKPVMQAYIEDQTVKAPIRRQAQTFESSEKALDRDAAVAAAQLKAQQDAARARQANETTLKAAEIRAGKQPAGSWVKVGEAEDGSGTVFYNPTSRERQTVSGTTPPAKALTPKQQDQQTDAADMIGKLKDTRAMFSDSMAGNWRSALMGNETLPLGKYIGSKADTKTAEMWGQFRGVINQVRHGLFGASLTRGEKAAFDSTTVDSYTKPDLVKSHMDKLITYAERGARRQKAMAEGGTMDPETGAVTLRGRVVPGTEAADPVGKFVGLDNPSVRQSLEAAIAQIADPNEKERAGQALRSQLGGGGGATGSWDAAPAKKSKGGFRVLSVE